MFTRLKEVLIERLSNRAAVDDEHASAIAAAMLLLEVAWADHDISDAELDRSRVALEEIFGLPNGVAEAIVAAARERHGAAISMYPFTRVVNETLTPEEKLALLTNCWRLANAHAGVDHHEEHTIRRIADLIHLSHDDFIRAKLTAKAAC
jgi:uncharacterized tellurite resistance protein B-like protein